MRKREASLVVRELPDEQALAELLNSMSLPAPMAPKKREKKEKDEKKTKTATLRRGKVSEEDR
jgi:hypothetical protein